MRTIEILDKSKEVAAGIFGAVVGTSLGVQADYAVRWNEFQKMFGDVTAKEVLSIFKPFADRDISNLTPFYEVRDILRSNPDTSHPLWEDRMRVAFGLTTIVAVDSIVGALSKYVATSPHISPKIRDFEASHSSYLASDPTPRQRASRALVDTGLSMFIIGRTIYGQPWN